MQLEDKFYCTPTTATMVMATKDLQKLLLHTEGWVMAIGHMWDIKSKKIGPGIYQVKLKLKDI